MKRSMTVVLVVALFFIPVDAMATTLEAPQGQSGADETVFDFDSLDVTGARQGPLGTRVGGGHGDNIRDLITLRQDFVDVLMRSVDDI